MKNIILIGFMGSGKSTIGRKLSEKYGLKHIDTDWYIEKEQNMKISDIFSKKGEEYFRNLETECIKKLIDRYKDNIVVDDVNMHISKGAIYGFVGPNGAGKSTVMKMILSLIQPDAGEVQLLGEKVTSHSYEIFKKVGSIIENPYFYDKMTARQNLELHCEYMGFPNESMRFCIWWTCRMSRKNKFVITRWV